MGKLVQVYFLIQVQTNIEISFEFMPKTSNVQEGPPETRSSGPSSKARTFVELEVIEDLVQVDHKLLHGACVSSRQFYPALK